MEKGRLKEGGRIRAGRGQKQHCGRQAAGTRAGPVRGMGRAVVRTRIAFTRPLEPEPFPGRAGFVRGRPAGRQELCLCRGREKTPAGTGRSVSAGVFGIVMMSASGI